MKIFFIVIFSFISFALFAQDDLLKMLDTLGGTEKSHDKVNATFNTSKIISMQTPQTMGAGELDFRITHRFGNVGKASNGGIHTLYGWDAIEDVRISFDYGITKKLQVGIARNKKRENLNVALKWRLLDQTTDNKVPLSIDLYGLNSFTPMRESQLYSGADSTWVTNNKEFVHRIGYFSQIIFARKFGSRFSLAISPCYLHRNYVLAEINPANNVVNENGIFSGSIGLRLKLTRSFSILADYFYVMSDFRKNNPNQTYHNPLAIGVEIETGGHVFHLDLTNASGIAENYFIANTTDSWGKGGYKFGFHISRVFTIVHK